MATKLNLTTGVVYVRNFSGGLSGGGGFSLTSGQFLAPDGTVGAPSYSFTNDSNTGLFSGGAGQINLAIDGANVAFWSAGNLTGPSTIYLGTGQDAAFLRLAANTLGMRNVNADQMFRMYGANGGYWEKGTASELIVLSTSGTTTDSTANLLPALSIIEAVVARVTTTIATATSWRLSDPTTVGRFSAANATMAAGTTDVGLVHVDIVGAGGPRQTAAAKLRITTVGTPSAGAVRVIVFYRTFVPPTS